MISFNEASENSKADDLSIRSLVRVINNIMRGKTNNRGEVTLTAGAASTIVEDINAGGESVIDFMPLTANAAIAKQTMYVSSQGKQTFTITHANNAQVDKSFRYVITG